MRLTMLLPNDFFLSATLLPYCINRVPHIFLPTRSRKETGLRIMLSGTDSLKQLRRDPEQARIFDSAMTTMSKPVAPAQFCIVEALPA
jgi:hypothetical protein